MSVRENAARERYKTRMHERGRCITCGGAIEVERSRGLKCFACQKRYDERKRKGRPIRVPNHCSNCGREGHNAVTCGL
jgi:hypothetical protein